MAGLRFIAPTAMVLPAHTGHSVSDPSLPPCFKQRKAHGETRRKVPYADREDRIRSATRNGSTARIK
ncbi:hypothetical protein PG996_012311 [Apiospora saccharicola]|uniref:Uncharacterized protein n=1 Tax=Apiospora saccharicola TaxID=335842 RepID=A0ABR1U279_9PEZI